LAISILAVFCAIVTLAKHVIEDISSSSNDTTLILHPLSCNSAFVKVGDDVTAALQGCYLHFDGVKSKWIRSGKVCGTKRNFGTRQMEHEKGASGTPVLRFHSLYPANSNTAVSPVRKGYFHHLHQYVGIGFEQSDNCISTLGNHGKLFAWENNVLDALSKYSLHNCSSVKEKQYHMVSYALELGYDLMISPNDNVSTSPGFESVLQVYGGSA